MNVSGDESSLLMGHVGRAHGLKGEITTIWHGDAPPVKGMNIFLHHGGRVLAKKILAVHTVGGRYILKLQGIDDRSAAGDLTGAEIYVSRDSLPKLEEGEIYLRDIAGYEVYLADGQDLGKLDHLEFPANRTVWSIISRDGVEILFPAEPQFIVSFDKERRRVYIDPPPGLMDVYRA